MKLQISLKFYKSGVELKQNLLVKRLRTGKGDEYYKLGYFQYNGIIHETHVSYAPHTNGVAERKYKTL